MRKKRNFLKSLACKAESFPDAAAAAARAPGVAPPPRAATHSKPWQQMQAPVAQPSQAAPGQAQAQAQEQPTAAAKEGTGARRGRKRGAQAVDQLSFKKECAYAVALKHRTPCSPVTLYATLVVEICLMRSRSPLLCREK